MNANRIDCADTTPDPSRGRNVLPLVCTRRAGHSGMHSNGATMWSHLGDGRRLHDDDCPARDHFADCTCIAGPPPAPAAP